ncbi:MAG: hypothetical protein AAF772_15340, partial [Acidobacteriota bacterium]
RALAWDWARRLAGPLRAQHGLEVRFFGYRHAGTNNGDLPSTAWPLALDDDGADPRTLDADRLTDASTAAVPFETIFASHDVLLAPTELSATAPLKLGARRHGFRAATMPGLSPAMMDALRVDITAVDRRVRTFQALLSRAESAALRLRADGRDFDLTIDLRHRTAHASSGLLDQPGVAGNLPSGEAYIVPYEGERPGTPSATRGRLPVQLDDEVVVYDVENNRAVAVRDGGPVAQAEAARLARHPAYGNIAELGLGVLGAFGVKPIGVILLDEKLGLHIAFGRSDHFGGVTGAEAFGDPDAMVHIDRVYLPETQPRVAVTSLDLTLPDGTQQAILRDGRYV